MSTAVWYATSAAAAAAAANAAFAAADYAAVFPVKYAAADAVNAAYDDEYAECAWQTCELARVLGLS